jgi:hypothetical protein
VSPVTAQLYFPDGLVARILNLRFNSYDAQVESRAMETRIFAFNSIFAQDHTAAALPDQAQITIDVIGAWKQGRGADDTATCIRKRSGSAHLAVSGILIITLGLAIKRGLQLR